MAALRLAAGIGYLGVAVGLTATSRGAGSVVVLPLLAYAILAAWAFAFRRRGTATFLSLLIPFLDIGAAFFVLHAGIVFNPTRAASWATGGLGAYALVVALAGLSLPVRLAIAQAIVSAFAQSGLLLLAGLGWWPSLAATCALACVAFATSRIPRLTAAAFHQEQDNASVRAFLAHAQEQNLRLERLQREKDSLLELIVHDMRSPVGATLLSLEYLGVELRKNPAHAPLLEAVDDALGTLNSLSVMIAQILDTTKLESGRITLHPDIGELRPIIEETVQLAAPRARSRSVTMTFDASETVQAAIDLRLFPRALQVLVSHCLRHTTEGGRMLISTATCGSEVMLSIHSSGPAIPREERESMFDKFPLAGLENRRNSAWGLGLYFCRLVASVHQGTLAVEDVDGWAASFVIRLPSVRRSAQSAG